MFVQPYTIDIAIAWAWIVSSLVLIAAGLLLARSRIGRAGTLIYLGSLLLLAFSVFKVHPALVRVPLSDDTIRLREELLLIRDDRDRERAARIREEAKLASNELQLRTTAKEMLALEESINQLRKAVDAQAVARGKAEQKAAADVIALADADRQLKSFETTSRDLQTRLSETQKELSETRASLHRELAQAVTLGKKISQVKLQLKRTTTDLQTELQHSEALRKELTAEKSALSATVATIAALEKRLAASAAALELLKPSAAPSVAVAIKARIDSGVATETYSIAPYSGTELTRARAGAAYVVTLKNKETGIPFRFKSKQFGLAEDETKFLESLQAFASDILRPIQLQPFASFEIFIRGRADGGRAIGPLPPTALRFQTIAFLPLRSGTYDEKTIDQVIAGNIENWHLPILRAASVAELFGKIGLRDKVKILEGVTLPETDEAQRAVDIYLHVEAN